MDQQQQQPASDSRNRWLSARQVAEALGVSEDTIYRLVAEGRLPHLRVRRAIRLRLQDIESALANTQIGSSSPA